MGGGGGGGIAINRKTSNNLVGLYRGRHVG